MQTNQAVEHTTSRVHRSSVTVRVTKMTTKITLILIVCGYSFTPSTVRRTRAPYSYSHPLDPAVPTA